MQLCDMLQLSSGIGIVPVFKLATFGIACECLIKIIWKLCIHCLHCWEGRTYCCDGRSEDSDLITLERKEQGVTVLLQDVMTEKCKLMNL